MRARLLEKYREEELTLLRNQNIFDKDTAHIRENASDRFQKANEVLQKKDIQTLESISDQDIDALSNDYVEGSITRE